VLQSEGVVYFLEAVCTDVFLRATRPYLRCNQFQPRKNEWIACRLPALLLVTCANYVSTESHACANTRVYALLLLCDTCIRRYICNVYLTSHFFSFYFAYSRLIYMIYMISHVSAITYDRKSWSRILRDFSRMFVMFILQIRSFALKK